MTGDNQSGSNGVPAREEQIGLTLSDGVELAARLYLPRGAPRGTVAFLHGMQSHSGWFVSTARQLAQAGFLALFADRRSAGLNPRDQIDGSNMGVLVRDVAEIGDHARRIAAERGVPGNRPFGLIGHSFGGLLSVLALCRQIVQPDWLFLISPMLVSQPSAKQLRSWREISFVLKVYFSSRRKIDIPYSYEALTNSLEGQQFMENDRLMLRKVEARFFKSYLTAMTVLLGNFPQKPIQCPVLLSLAEKDLLVNNAKTEKLVRKLCAGDLHIHLHKDCGHTIELSPSRDEQVPTLLAFLGNTEENPGSHG